MKHPIKLCSAVAAVCFLYAASVSIGQDSASPSSSSASETAAVDIDALARKADAIVALAVKHHIEPPTPAEMWLAGTHALQLVTRRQDPFLTPQDPFLTLSGRAPTLDTPELRREFLGRALPGEALAKLQADLGAAPGDLLQAFVGGMVPQGADLKSARDIKREESFRANRYVGTGIALFIDKSSGYPGIAALIAGPGPMKHGPMERAGGKQGDLIVRIDDHDTQRMRMDRVIELLSGDEGTTVTLELRAPSASASRTTVVTRGHIRLPSLAGVDGSDLNLGNHRIKADSPIRYVEVRQINGSTVHDLRQLERRFRSDGGRAVIIDFRGTEDNDLNSMLSRA